MSQIEIKNLTFSYNDTCVKEILNDFSYSVDAGEFISILGPSGSGKSTLLSLLSGFRMPDSGTINFNGNRVSSPYPSGQMVFQEPSQLLPWLNVRKNILFPKYRSLFLSRRVKISDEDELHLERLLTKTGLKEFKSYLPSRLSGGLKQRTAIARALFAQPEVLFMDEPFVSLDAPTRADLQSLLIRLWQEEKKTLFFVTHDISEALLLSDKILVFKGDNSGVEMVDNRLERPRNRDSKEFIGKKLELYSMIDAHD